MTTGNDSPRHQSARYYRTARTAHLERLQEQKPGDFFYQNRMYDFDGTKAPTSSNVSQIRLLGVLRLVWRKQYRILEIVEPYAPSAIPQNLAICMASRISRYSRGEPTQLVCYAIENADLPGKFSRQYRLPLWVTRLALRLTVGFCYETLSKVVFGTADAQRNYHKLLEARGKTSRRQPASRLIEGLSRPHPATRNADDRARPARLIFLGAFDRRKGIRELLAAWPQVRKALPAAELLVMGKGPLEQEVLVAASALEGVNVIVDPPRDEIWQRLQRGTALCLLSQPAPGWKEQIGLPIVEGLSFGLEIVASDETGVADWLRAHGHRVVAHDASPDQLATAILAALTSPRGVAQIISGLPNTDGRTTADAWLHDAND